MIKRKIKKNEPDPTELKLEKFLRKVWTIIRKESKRFGRWTFFYQPENNMDAVLHIITLLAYIFIGFRLINQ